MAFHDWECTQNAKFKEKAAKLKVAMNKKTWWKSVIYAYHVMMPVMYAICNLNQKTPNLVKVWMQWWTVQCSLENPKKLEDSVVEKYWRVPFSSRQQKVLLKYFHARWIRAHMPLKIGTYMLDP